MSDVFAIAELFHVILEQDYETSDWHSMLLVCKYWHYTIQAISPEKAFAKGIPKPLEIYKRLPGASRRRTARSRRLCNGLIRAEIEPIADYWGPLVNGGPMMIKFALLSLRADMEDYEWILRTPRDKLIYIITTDIQVATRSGYRHIIHALTDDELIRVIKDTPKEWYHARYYCQCECMERSLPVWWFYDKLSPLYVGCGRRHFPWIVEYRTRYPHTFIDWRNVCADCVLKLIDWWFSLEYQPGQFELECAYPRLREVGAMEHFQRLINARGA